MKHKIKKQNSGSALVMVIFITAVIFLLGSSLFDSSYQGYKITLWQTKDDVGYTAGSNASEKILHRIVLYTEVPQIYSYLIKNAMSEYLGSPPDDVKLEDLYKEDPAAILEYSECFTKGKDGLGGLLELLKTGINDTTLISGTGEKLIDNIANGYRESLKSQGYSGDLDKKVQSFIIEIKEPLNGAIDVVNAVDPVNIVKANINEYSIKVLKAEMGTSDAKSKVDVDLGINVVFNFSSNGHTISQKFYAVKTIRIDIFTRYKLDCGINSIGDIVVDGGAPTPTGPPYNEPGSQTNNYYLNVGIKGNINSYGSFASKPVLIRNYLYGGVCVTKGARLDVRGSVYTRAGARVGSSNLVDYDYNSTYDGSELIVRKDIITGGITTFGGGVGIVIGRNAYVFDDIENDSGDSIITVNGKYFGLKPSGKSHDDTSAVLNLASIYLGASSPEAQLSRIVINGDFYTKGTAFKVDPNTGEVEGALGTAEIAIEKLPAYPLYIIPNYKSQDLSAGPYMVDPNNVYGPLTYIQTQPTNSGVDSDAINTIEENLLGTYRGWASSWQTQTTDAARVAYSISSSPPSTLIGMSSGIVAANYGIYSTSESVQGDFRVRPYPGLTPQEILALKEKYFDDLITKKTIPTYNDKIMSYPSDKVVDEWKSILSSTNWPDYADSTGTLSGSVKYGLKVLREFLEPTYVNKLVGGKYGADQTPYYHYANPAILGDKNDIIHTPVIESITQKPMFEYILNAFSLVFGSSSDPQIIKIPSGTPTQTLSGDPSKYYLVINEDHNVDLIIDDKFNGFIISKGRVIFEKGAIFKGIIFAAGRNYIGGCNADTSTHADIAKIETDETDDEDILTDKQKSITDGDYAGVLIRSGTIPPTATVATNTSLDVDITGNTIDEIVSAFKLQSNVGNEIASVISRMFY